MSIFRTSATTSGDSIDRLYLDAESRLLGKEEPVQRGYSYAWSWHLFDVIEGGEIKEANGENFIQFTFAGNCLVDIHLTQNEEFVIVQLTQKNIPEDDKSKKDIRLGCDTGWSFYLVNLKSVYEGGLDLRNKNPSLKGMLNS